jgi:hypothetical protein
MFGKQEPDVLALALGDAKWFAARVCAAEDSHRLHEAVIGLPKLRWKGKEMLPKWSAIANAAETAEQSGDYHGGAVIGLALTLLRVEYWLQGESFRRPVSLLGKPDLRAWQTLALTSLRCCGELSPETVVAKDNVVWWSARGTSLRLAQFLTWMNGLDGRVLQDKFDRISVMGTLAYSLPPLEGAGYFEAFCVRLEQASGQVEPEQIASWSPATPVPSVAVVAAPTTNPAGWYPDPSGRFELRFWAGTQWSEHVSRAGQQYLDSPVY